MDLPVSSTNYGFTFTLNVAVKTSRMNWNGTEPAYAHFCLIELGDNQADAEDKARTIKAAMSAMGCYKFTMQATPKICTYSEEL